jgi:hypothetical protein
LTKTLKSLKSFYYGKSGILSPNCGEILSYYILAYIKGRNEVVITVLREIPQIIIKNSIEIKFALSVVKAVRNSNYLQFFHLLKKANLLQVIQ